MIPGPLHVHTASSWADRRVRAVWSADAMPGHDDQDSSSMGAASTRPALRPAVTQRVVGPDRAHLRRPASRFSGRAACFAAILIAFERGLAQDESAAERLLHLVRVS